MIRKLASLQLFFILAATLVLAMTLGTLLPQNQSPEKYHEIFSHTTYRILQGLGVFDLYHSIWFVSLLALLGVNTAACISMRISERKLKKLPWGAIVSHAAFLLILAGGMVSGLWGKKGILELGTGQTQCCVPIPGSAGETLHLPFQVHLKDFNVEYYDGGRHYVQLVHTLENWQETLQVTPGENYTVRGKIQLKVVQFLPDFRLEKEGKTGRWKPYSVSSNPNNPALQVELTASPTRKIWLFARYPEFSHLMNSHEKTSGSPLQVLYEHEPAKIKQFRSRIEIVEKSESVQHAGAESGDQGRERTNHDAPKVMASGEIAVNHPFQYQAYTLYQTGYDPKNPEYSSSRFPKIRE